jgi:hypothetical protein
MNVYVQLGPRTLFRIFNAYVYRVFQKAKAKKKSKSHKTKSHKSAKLQEKQRRTFNSLGRKMDMYNVHFIIKPLFEHSFAHRVPPPFLFTREDR